MSLIDGVGCWREILAAHAQTQGRAALFLDRDGVIVQEPGYLGRAEDVVMIAGAAEAIARANRAGVPVVLITNQAGVARGYFGWDGFAAVQDEIDRALAAADARLDAVLACGYHGVGSGPLNVADHPWRKPNPGMLCEAAAAMGLDLARSAVVGDKASDLKAGRAAGLSLGVHVATGHGGDPGEQAAARALARPGFQVRLDPDLPAAADALLAALAGR